MKFSLSFLLFIFFKLYALSILRICAIRADIFILHPKGRVSEVQSARKVKKKSILALHFDSATLPDGSTVAVSTGFRAEGAGYTKKDGAIIGGSAAGGAILGQVLSTRTGRLFKGLVLTNEVATDAWGHQMSQKWAGSFNIGGEAKDGRTPADVEAAIYGELDNLASVEVPAEELQKVKNNFAAGEFRKLGSNMAILNQLMHCDGLGDWRSINESGAKFQAVTAADVQRVVKEYFTKENRTVATYTRKQEISKAK